MIAALVAGVFLPIDIPYAFKSVAQVYPVQKWMLQKNNDGSLTSSLHNYKSGLMRDYSNFQFERGDVVSMHFNSEKTTEKYIDSGDLIVNILSNQLAGTLINLENQLSIESANLAKERAGQKAEIITGSAKAFELAQSELKLAKLNLDRAIPMLEDGLIAKMEYDQLEGLYQQALRKIEMAKANIEINTTGEKPEQIQLIETRIQSLRKEIDFIKTTSNSYNIYAPISGTLRYESDLEGDRMIIEDTSEYILFVPIKLKDRTFIGPDTRLELVIVGQDSLIPAQILEVSKKTEILNETLVAMIKAKVDGSIKGLAPEMPIACKVSCGTVRPIEYMKRSIKVDVK